MSVHETDAKDTVASFPAAPGTKILLPIHDPQFKKIVGWEDFPVVGFLVTSDGIVRAASYQGVYEQGPILHPDGIVEDFDRQRWPSLQAFLDDCTHKPAEAA